MLEAVPFRFFTLVILPCIPLSSILLLHEGESRKIKTSKCIEEVQSLSQTRRGRFTNGIQGGGKRKEQDEGEREGEGGEGVKRKGKPQEEGGGEGGGERCKRKGAGKGKRDWEKEWWHLTK